MVAVPEEDSSIEDVEDSDDGRESSGLEMNLGGKVELVLIDTGVQASAIAWSKLSKLRQRLDNPKMSKKIKKAGMVATENL